MDMRLDVCVCRILMARNDVHAFDHWVSLVYTRCFAGCPCKAGLLLTASLGNSFNHYFTHSLIPYDSKIAYITDEKASF